MSIKDKTKSKKRIIISQKDIPWCGIEKALKVARVLWDQFAGKSAQPLQVAVALELSPTSTNWKYLSGASTAYGLTEGGYNSKEITLTPIGKAIVAPTDENEDKVAILQAVLLPSYLNLFYEKYNNAKLPSETIGENVLVSMGVPKEKASTTFELIVENGRFAGIIQDTKVGTFVSLNISETKLKEDHAEMPPVLQNNKNQEVVNETVDDFAKRVSYVNDETFGNSEPNLPVNNRVFISHGKNKMVVEQLKEIIKFGKYEPVVSIENETLSKPVPDKVLDDMRSCFAGIINVHSEGEMLDVEGNRHIKVNDNVLIEIGAAMALYDNNYILLVQKGVRLPSNLQGLYRCEYEGEKLDYEATMKLLKAFNQFK